MSKYILMIDAKKGSGCLVSDENGVINPFRAQITVWDDSESRDIRSTLTDRFTYNV